jgi:hypothetical protein
MGSIASLIGSPLRRSFLDSVRRSISLNLRFVKPRISAPGSSSGSTTLVGGAAWTRVIGRLSRSQTFLAQYHINVQRFGPILPGRTLKKHRELVPKNFLQAALLHHERVSTRAVASGAQVLIESITFSCPIGTRSATRSTQYRRSAVHFHPHTEADLLLQACLTGPRSLPANCSKGRCVD